GSCAGVAGQRSALTDEVGVSVEQLGDARHVAFAGGIQQFGERAVVAGLRADCRLERRPSGMAILERECVLHIAQRWLSRWIGDDACEACSGFGVVFAKCVQPALRLPLEILEGTTGREFPAHGNLPPGTPEVR